MHDIPEIDVAAEELVSRLDALTQGLETALGALLRQVNSFEVGLADIAAEARGIHPALQAVFQQMPIAVGRASDTPVRSNSSELLAGPPERPAFAMQFPAGAQHTADTYRAGTNDPAKITLMVIPQKGSTFDADVKAVVDGVIQNDVTVIVAKEFSRGLQQGG